MPPKRSTSRGRSRSRSKPSSPAASPKAARKPDMTAEEAYHIDIPCRFTPEKDPWRGDYEFNGPWGALGIMIFSHVIIYYFFVCLSLFEGTLIYPGHAMLKGEPMSQVFLGYLGKHASLTCKSLFTFWAFLLLEYVLTLVCPAIYVKGLPLPSENGARLTYKCNAVSAWYAVLVIAGVLHYTGVYPLQTLRHEFGHYVTAATVTADAIAVAVYIVGLRRPIRMTGNFIYDFFLGSGLNFGLPGNVDVKMFMECRNSWVLLMLLTLSCAAEQYQELGRITVNMGFMVFAHLLYVNAVQKGEECIITTWDIYYEKFGWMLAYWNTCGVPFLYCMQSIYIQTVLKDKEHPKWVIGIMVVALLACYYVWDTINSQKNRFRMYRSGVPMSIIKRATFPQLPWRFIEHPRTIKSAKGELFVDGFYRYGRKIHYTVDVAMALLWGSSCGFQSYIPFFYASFFITHLVDRERRDEMRCKDKYGKLWDEYVELVPYKFIPGIY
ncbi:sterol C-24 reductase [Strigomonas culicis]|uniref:Delta(24(24(1)))-sterol reductase n=1 Tax=Strigomonas culicis TaxID=28005 RepID=S9VIH2_9TRYP|nr:delta24(24(1))-sterol reductase [Strigomonas culicis]EPY35575.1 sterol C-24 reductase [Strigomonas culicis]|eukprot:EPY23025.1 delta24(24(1))-sterol reductase [Strigomonas culicis]